MNNVSYRNSHLRKGSDYDSDLDLGNFDFDVSETMVAEAKQKSANTEFFITDLTSSQTPVTDVDLITAFRFFGNAEQELRQSVLNALSGIVKPGGYLIINNHRNPGSLHHRLLRLKGETSTLDLSHANLENLLQSNGFEIEKKIGVGLWVYRHALRRNTATSGSPLRYLEPLSRINFLAPYCPDYVVIAKKL